ncbi:hypothetical protein H0X48_05370 [Candidatus Dependentiae bacterium]|nr:hypothetical protein [Candidatus Dependentiae bacterium]
MHKLYTNHTKHLAVLLALVVHVVLLALLFYQTIPSLPSYQFGQENTTSVPAPVSFGDIPKTTQSISSKTSLAQLAAPIKAPEMKKPESFESQSIDSSQVDHSLNVPEQQLPLATLPTTTPMAVDFQKTLLIPENTINKVAVPVESSTRDSVVRGSDENSEGSYESNRPLPVSTSGRGTHYAQEQSGQQTTERPRRRRTRNSARTRSSTNGSIFQDFASAVHSAKQAHYQEAQTAYEGRYSQARGTNVSAAQIAQVEKQTAQFRYLSYNSNAHKTLRTTFNIYRTEVEVPYDISTAVDITVTIDSEGKVLESSIIPSLNMPEVEASIIETIRKAHFAPLPKNFNTTRHTFSEHVTVNLHKGMCRIICS